MRRLFETSCALFFPLVLYRESGAKTVDLIDMVIQIRLCPYLFLFSVQHILYTGSANNVNAPYVTDMRNVYFRTYEKEKILKSKFLSPHTVSLYKL